MPNLGKKAGDAVNETPSIVSQVEDKSNPESNDSTKSKVTLKQKTVVKKENVPDVATPSKNEEEKSTIDKPQVTNIAPAQTANSSGFSGQQRPQVRPQYQSQQNRQPVRVEMKVETRQIEGVLEIMNDGSGAVRPKFNPGAGDAYISAMNLRKIGLRGGDMIEGEIRVAREGEKIGALTKVIKVNGEDLSASVRRPDFKDLVPIFPTKQLHVEFDPGVLSTRIIDLFCPIGFGQRGMIVSPPKAGKTTLLKEIAAGVAANHPEVHLMAVLVGERPEEVTDMQRFIKGEVIASHFDQKPEDQTRAAEIAIERAKRLVEMGKDVFIVFDSITRLARAYNLAIPTSGRTLSGGFDPAALYPSKRFFGAARNIEGGGSLTIIGTALVDTGSKMDELIFEEFKGTGNMELRLERNLAERRIFPAFDILKSGTRKEELLLKPEVLETIMKARRFFDGVGDANEAAMMIIEQMMKTKSNAEFLSKMMKGK